MKRLNAYSLLFCTLFFLCYSFSDNPLNRIIARFQKYLDELPQEKAYLHFDRPYYAAGETIWFKVYLTAGAFHIPSTLSRTIYVELISPDGKLIIKQKLLSINGSAAGTITLPDSLSSGKFLIRSYTNWMKNSGEDYLFHRHIRIWNDEAQTSTTVVADNTLDFQLFPEGGELVNRISSNIGFKALGPDGLSRQVNGKIVDQSGALVCEFESNVLGMGSFKLTPIHGKKYIAILENYQQQITLPVVKEFGLVMSVTNLVNSSTILLRIETSDQVDLKTIYIVAQTRGVVCYAAQMDLSAKVMMARIPKSKFPSGVAQITVADQDGVPLAERLIFVNEIEQMNIEVTADKTSYSPRELVSLQIKATNADGSPAVADLSLAVCDNLQVPPVENQETISTYLLLSSELRGHIESPGYYFDPKNKDGAEALDYLLLTQGWRRFTFKKALDAQWENPEFKIEKGLTIKGKMLYTINSNPVVDGKVTYLSYEPITMTSSTRTNSKGEFELSALIYFDSAKSVLQGESKKGGKLIKFVIDSSPDLSGVTYPRLSFENISNEIDTTFIAASTERKKIDEAYNFDEKVIVLDELKIRGEREDPQTRVSKVYGKGTATVQVAGVLDMNTHMHPLQLLQGRVGGVVVTGGGPNLSVSIRGVGTPFIMIDDIPATIDNLSALFVNDIERIEIWKGGDAAMFGSRGGNGVIGFYTKMGAGMPVREGMLTLENRGFEFEKQFYSPNYEFAKPEHVKPDKRPTLFWAPLLQTDSAGQASVSFYNHDLETTITGIVEGISTTGKPGASTFKYSITKN